MANTDSGSTQNGWKEYVKYVISAFVSVTHIIAFFQIVICSRHLAVAFNIPPKNIGIYFAKLYSLRSLLMSLGCGVEYGIYRVIETSSGSGSEKNNTGNTAKEVRKYLSMGWFVLLTICEISFLIVLYSSKNVAYHNYIVLNLEGMLFGFFQMSVLSLIPEFAAYYMVSLYVSGTCIFIIQTIIDRCTKNSMLSVKIQSWICVLCSLICVGIWPVRLFVLTDTEQNTQSNSNSGSNSGGSSTNSGTCNSSSRQARSAGFVDHPSVYLHQHDSKIEYLMTMSSISVLKIMTTKLDELCKSLNPEAIMNVQMLITRLQQITRERDISYDVMVAIDLVILALKKCGCEENKLCLLADLSLFLRMKVLIKPLEKEQTQHSAIEEVSYSYGRIGVKDCKNGGTGEPVVVASGRYMGLIKSTQSQTLSRKKREGPFETKLLCQQTGESRRTSRSISEESLQVQTQGKRRQRRNTQEPTQQCKSFVEHLFASLSQVMMFPVGSLIKDFLFPGVIPYGLLERDKCHLINLIVIIFLSIGPVTIFVLNKTIEEFKKDNTYIHLCWNFMIPKIIILIISLTAIHTKQGCTHQIRSSQPIVLFMTVVLLTCYGFLETMSFVGMAHYVKFISKEPTRTVDLQAIQNVFGKFFRYFVYKFSVGYNKTRIGAGFTLPNFKPPEPISDTFWFWFSGAFSNGWKDIKGDFRMGIQQYLSVS